MPPNARGRAFALYQFIEFLIVPVVALLGWLLVPRQPLGLDGWRWVAIIASVGALAAWWLRRALPESPRWLAMHGKKSARRAHHARHRGQRGARPGACAAAAQVPATARVESQGRFVELLRPPHRKRLIVMSVFNLLAVIGFYGFSAWVPTLLIAKGVEITKSLQYAFIIAIANPFGPLLGLLDRRPDGAEVADRVRRHRHRRLHGAVRHAGRPGGGDRLRCAGHLVEQLALVYLPQLPGRAVPDPPAWPRRRFRVWLGRASAAIVGLLIGFFSVSAARRASRPSWALRWC